MKKKYRLYGFLPKLTFILLAIVVLLTFTILYKLNKVDVFEYVLWSFILIFVLFSILFIFIISMQTTKIDEMGIVQQNPLREVISIKWEDVKKIKIIKFVFKAIYITSLDLSDGEMLNINPYKEENKLLRILYSKKAISEIKKFYKGEIDILNNKKEPKK